MLGIARAQRRQVRGDITRLDRAEVVDSGRGQAGDVPVEIAPVRAERVGRERPLDGQVVEIGADRAVRGDQLSTS